jgi:hypothetical protein
VVGLSPRFRIHTLAVELRIDRVGTDLAGVQALPDSGEPVVVLTTAQRARAVPGGEGRRLVQEEELRETTGLEE